jgi:hypothetical protein
MTEGRPTSEWFTIASSISPRYTEHVEPVVLRFTAEDAAARTSDTCRETVGSIVKQIER